MSFRRQEEHRRSADAHGSAWCEPSGFSCPSTGDHSLPGDRGGGSAAHGEIADDCSVSASWETSCCTSHKYVLGTENASTHGHYDYLTSSLPPPHPGTKIWRVSTINMLTVYFFLLPPQLRWIIKTTAAIWGAEKQHRYTAIKKWNACIQSIISLQNLNTAVCCQG